MPSSPAQLPAAKVTIQRGLEGQDDNIDLLQSYFKELKAVTVEPSPPDVDMLTFAICTHYFGVITLARTQQDANDDDAEGEPEEDSLDAGYVASPPPWSSAKNLASPRSAVLKDSISKPSRSHTQPLTAEDEKILKWREAFFAHLQEPDSEVEPLLSKGKMRESQSIPQERPVPIPSASHDLDDYINWPDDAPSPDECSGDLSAQDDQLDEETIPYYPLDGGEFTPVLGREILEPEQFSAPVKMSEIPPDPKLKEIMHEEALKYQGMLRAQRIKAYQEASAPKPFFEAPAPKPLFIEPPVSGSVPIGIIYLASSQTVDDPMHRGQLNIGIYVAPKYIELPSLVQTVKRVVSEAFQDASCHRVQAIVVDHKTKFDTLELYTSCGFSREGIGRREFFSPITHEWKDVFYFAILATDWVFDNDKSARPRPKTLWDDLLVCQQREREELLRMEEKTLKRSSSVETIRNRNAPPMAPSIASTSRLETSSVTSSSISAAPTTDSSIRKGSPKRRRIEAEFDYVKRPRAPSTSASSSIGTFETMSTVSSDWELPARQAFALPASNGAPPPAGTSTAGPSTSPTGGWVMLDVSNDN